MSICSRRVYMRASWQYTRRGPLGPATLGSRAASASVKVRSRRDTKAQRGLSSFVGPVPVPVWQAPPSAEFLRGARRRPGREGSGAHVVCVGCNGVPSCCYEPLMDRMREMGDVTTNTVEVYPYAGEDWRRAIDAVITAAIRARKGLRGEAVVGFGHSLGGSLLYAASTRVPGLFDSLVLFDSPLFHPMKRAGILLLQKLRLMELLPLVIRARRRRSHFESFEEATQYILSRRLYQSFHPEVLEALMDDGLVETEDGDVCFAFSPEAEARFFKGTPTDLHPLLNPEMHVASRMRGTAPWIGQYEQSRCPGTYIFSNRHEFLGPYDIVYLQQALQGPAGEPFEFEEVREGHYMPLQDLDATADMLACLIDARHGLRRRRKLRVAFAAPEDQGFLGRDSDTQEENILRASSG